MRTAPSVSVVVPVDRVWVIVTRSLALAAALVVALWAGSAHSSRVPAAAMRWTLAAATAAMAGLVVFRRFPASVQLRWDGQDWWLQRQPGLEAVHSVHVVIDFGAWLLLRCAASDAAGTRRTPTRWLALQRGKVPTQWHGLRCALHAGGASSRLGSEPADPRAAP